MMKFIFGIAFFLLVINASAQTLDSLQVPSAVRHTFDSVYPTLKNDSKWQFNTDSLYVASVFMQGLSKNVYITREGHIRRVITDMPISRTPPDVKDALDKKYKDYQILSISADLKYATMAYRDSNNQLKDMPDYKLLDYNIKISVDGKIFTVNYNYNTHQLMDNDKL